MSAVDHLALGFGVLRVTFDVLDLEPLFRPGFKMVVDGRIRTANFLREHFKREYRFTERPEYFNFLFELID